MKNRSTLFAALLRLFPPKWQKVFEHSRMIKYYRILRRFRKNVLRKNGTLLFKKSILFLFVATVSSLFYLLCLQLNFFQFPLSKIGCSLGSRVLFSLSRGLGCEGGLLLVFILIAFGIVDETIMNMTGETVNQGPHRGDAGSYSTENSEADSGSWRQYLNLSSDKEENAGPSNALPAPSPSGSFPPVPEAFTPEPSTARAPADRPPVLQPQPPGHQPPIQEQPAANPVEDQPVPAQQPTNVPAQAPVANLPVNVGEASSSASDALELAKGKRPLEVNEINQDKLWDEVEKAVKRHKMTKDSDWTSDWVTSREDRLGDLINELRKEEHMRPLAPYRLQDVVDNLETKFSVENLEILIKDMEEQRLNSSFYKDYAKNDHNLPKEAELKASFDDVTKS